MEVISNLLQAAVTLLGFFLGGIRYLKSRKQEYFLLTCFYGCFFLGSFLSMLQYALSSAEERRFPCRKALSAVLIGVPLCMFYCTFGDILSNLLWCGMMIIVSCFSIRGLAYARRQRGTANSMKYFHIWVLCYVTLEYALWTSGCFWPGDSIFSPYCWFDLLLAGCLLALLPAMGKAVQE